MKIRLLLRDVEVEFDEGEGDSSPLAALAPMLGAALAQLVGGGTFSKEWMSNPPGGGEEPPEGKKN